MATWDLPSEIRPTAMEWVSIKAGVQFQSPFDGTVESIEFPGARWGISVTLAPKLDYDGGLTEAFFARVAGGVDRVRTYPRHRPQPRGTMRGTPTLAASVAQGALSLQITTTGSLSAGDFFGAGGQLFQCFADCTPSGGVLTVPLVQRVRASAGLASGTAVTWDRPTALFIVPATSNRASYGEGILNPMQIDMQEVFS